MPRCPAPLRATGAVALVALAAAVALGGAVLVAGPAHAGLLPSTVLPGDADGSTVALEPAAVRAPQGTAEVDVVLGAAAPGDVVVDLAVVDAEVTADGIVAPGPASAAATVTAGSRLRPGERLRVTVTGVERPSLLVATVTGATSPPEAADTDGRDAPDPSPTATPSADDGAPRELAALVLPGAPGPPPVVGATASDGMVTGTVTASAPLLVTVRMVGSATTTFADRLVVPDHPLVLEVEAARWPAPSVVTVTDEAGRSVAADTGRDALAAVAATLVALALLAAVLLHRRRRSAVSAPP